MALKISTIIVVHNEEKYVERCLESVRPISDELIVCHDGPCSDRSLELARKFTDQVYVNEFRGAPEANVIRMLKKAKNDWILRIDCDETLSSELMEKIRDLSEENPATHYYAIWKAYYKGAQDRPLSRHKPDRLLLYRKSCISWIGIPHRAPEIRGEKGEIYAFVEHRALHHDYSFFQLLTKKMIPFARQDADIRIRYPLETFNIGRLDTALRKRDLWRHRWPLLVSLPLALLVFFRAFLACFKAESFQEFRKNIRWPLAHGAYQLFLGYYIYKAKKHMESP